MDACITRLTTLIIAFITFFTPSAEVIDSVVATRKSKSLPPCRINWTQLRPYSRDALRFVAFYFSLIGKISFERLSAFGPRKESSIITTSNYFMLTFSTSFFFSPCLGFLAPNTSSYEATLKLVAISSSTMIYKNLFFASFFTISNASLIWRPFTRGIYNVVDPKPGYDYPIYGFCRIASFIRTWSVIKSSIFSSILLCLSISRLACLKLLMTAWTFFLSRVCWRWKTVLCWTFLYRFEE